MAPPTKIQDEAEVRRWFEEGRTYRWMVEEYDRKYGMKVSATMFSSFRARAGIPRRIPRNDNLIPWEVAEEHRFAYPLAMLRVESRRRGGFEVRAVDEERLAAFKRTLYADDLVVHYDPDTEQGWWLVPRRPGVDKDLIRQPARKTTRRRNADAG